MHILVNLLLTLWCDVEPYEVDTHDFEHELATQLLYA